jgi:hypothetical protein
MQEGRRKVFFLCRGIFGCLGWVAALIAILLAVVYHDWYSVLNDRRWRGYELRSLLYWKVPLGTNISEVTKFLYSLPGKHSGPFPLSDIPEAGKHGGEVNFYYEELPRLRASGGSYVLYVEHLDVFFDSPPFFPAEAATLRVYFFFDKDGRLVRKVFIP